MRFEINTRATNNTRLTCLCRLLRTVGPPIDLTTKDCNHRAQHGSSLPDIDHTYSLCEVSKIGSRQAKTLT